MSFGRAIAFLAPQEGEWADDHRDRGGRTRWGISERAHPEVDLDNMTQAGAHVWYEEHYWKRGGVSLLPWPASLAVFDWHVHSGSRSMKALQQLVGLKGTDVDGRIGEDTMEAVNDYLQHQTASDLAYAVSSIARVGWTASVGS